MKEKTKIIDKIGYIDSIIGERGSTIFQATYKGKHIAVKEVKFYSTSITEMIMQNRSTPSSQSLRHSNIC